MFYINEKHCFSQNTCTKIITQAENIGFAKALINDGGTLIENYAIRNNSKIEFTNTYFALDLEKYAPKMYKQRKLSRVGDFFRIYKYEPGQFFKPHRDGHIELPGEESLLTVLVYLNTCPKAETVLMPYGFSQKWAHIEIPCEEGSMLIFDHDIWHSGKTVESGVKYVLRTDVFYKE